MRQLLTDSDAKGPILETFGCRWIETENANLRQLKTDSDSIGHILGIFGSRQIETENAKMRRLQQTLTIKAQF